MLIENPPKGRKASPPTSAAKPARKAVKAAVPGPAALEPAASKAAAPRPSARKPAAPKPAAPKPAAPKPAAPKPARKRAALDDDEGMATPMEPDFPGHDSFGLLLRMSMFGLRRAFKEQLAEFGVPWTVWYYLRVLWDRDGLSQKELTKWVGMLQPNAAGTIQSMQESGLVYIEREATDRRRIRIWLTPHGRELKELLLPRIRERIETVAFKGFKPEERQQLTKLLARVCTNIAESSTL